MGAVQIGLAVGALAFLWNEMDDEIKISDAEKAALETFNEPIKKKETDILPRDRKRETPIKPPDLKIDAPLPENMYGKEHEEEV